MFRFFQKLIAFRKTSNLVRRKTYNSGLKVKWHGVKTRVPDWGENSHSIALELCDEHEHLFLIFNAYWDDLLFELPVLPTGKKWKRLLDTSLESPGDIADSGNLFPLESQTSYKVVGRSTVVLAV